MQLQFILSLFLSLPFSLSPSHLNCFIFSFVSIYYRQPVCFLTIYILFLCCLSVKLCIKHSKFGSLSISLCLSTFFTLYPFFLFTIFPLKVCTILRFYCRSFCGMPFRSLSITQYLFCGYMTMFTEWWEHLLRLWQKFDKSVIQKIWIQQYYYNLLMVTYFRHHQILLTIRRYITHITNIHFLFLLPSCSINDLKASQRNSRLRDNRKQFTLINQVIFRNKNFHSVPYTAALDLFHWLETERIKRKAGNNKNEKVRQHQLIVR